LKQLSIENKTECHLGEMNLSPLYSKKEILNLLNKYENLNEFGVLNLGYLKKVFSFSNKKSKLPCVFKTEDNKCLLEEEDKPLLCKTKLEDYFVDAYKKIIILNKAVEIKKIELKKKPKLKSLKKELKFYEKKLSIYVKNFNDKMQKYNVSLYDNLETISYTEINSKKAIKEEYILVLLLNLFITNENFIDIKIFNDVGIINNKEFVTLTKREFALKEEYKDVEELQYYLEVVTAIYNVIWLQSQNKIDDFQKVIYNLLDEVEKELDIDLETKTNEVFMMLFILMNWNGFKYKDENIFFNKYKSFNKVIDRDKINNLYFYLEEKMTQENGVKESLEVIDNTSKIAEEFLYKLFHLSDI